MLLYYRILYQVVTVVKFFMSLLMESAALSIPPLIKVDGIDGLKGDVMCNNRLLGCNP